MQFITFGCLIRAVKILLIAVALLLSSVSKGQLLTNLGQYRNQLFVNTGYYLSFANYSLGWFHKEHINFLKRDVASILDFSFPISQNFYTKFVFRKGLQANIWQDSTWRVPLAIVGSSDKVITHLFRIHDFVTDVFLNPGIYKRRYTIALDLDYRVIWFSHYKQTNNDPNPLPNLPHHIRSRVALGVALGLNHKRFTYLLRSGYQQSADEEANPYSFYAVIQLGYNCNFKKRKAANSTAK